MSNFLKSLKKQSDITGLDADKIGGGVKTFAGGIYDATIEKAYIVISSGGAMGVYLGLDLANAEQQGKYSETIYITSRDGNNFYVDKRTNKKRYLPGFTTIDSLSQIITGKELADLNEEMRIVSVYDSEVGKEVHKQMPTLVDLIGRSFKVGLQQVKVNKEEKNNNGVYVPTAETKIINAIHKIFSAEGFTMTELEAAQGEIIDPVFINTWEKNFKDVVVDKTKKVDLGAKPAFSISSTNPSTPSESNTKPISLFE